MSAADFPAFFSDDEELLNSGGGDAGYAPAVPPSPDMSALGVSSLAPPPDAQLGPPAVRDPSSGGFVHDFLRQRAPDLGPSGSGGGGGGAMPSPRLAAPPPGPFGPYGPKGNLGPFGFRNQ